MPVARPAIHPKPECKTALVRELRVAASAAGYGDRCGTRPRARDQKERIVFSPPPFSLSKRRGVGKNISAFWKLTSMETHFVI